MAYLEDNLEATVDNSLRLLGAKFDEQDTIENSSNEKSRTFGRANVFGHQKV